MDEIILFDKSLKQRLDEYNEVFGTDFLSSSSVRDEWVYFLQMIVDVNGWQAIWKIPRLTCEHLNIPFPSVVLVLVLNVDFKNLNALIRVLAVQDDICIPEKNVVPLMEIWPTKEQDKTVGLNIASTANVLEMYRFFYLHIYMPWDREEDDGIDWKNAHLETRLRFYYELKNGSIPRQTAEHIHSLLTTARRLQNKRDLLENQLKNFDESGDADSEKKYYDLMEINVKIIEIRSEIEMYENPVMREILIKRQLDSKNISKKQQIWVIFNGGVADEYISFLEKIKIHYPKENLIFSTSLSSRLEMANSKDIFLLNEAEHVINTTGALESGGVLKGIGNNSKIILTSTIDDVMLDFISGDVLIENVTIDAKCAQCALIIRSGKGVLKNCKILGDGSSSTHQGIIVLEGAEIEMIDCDIRGFHASIVGNSGSKMTLENCNIQKSVVGIKLFDYCSANMNKVKISDCYNYGMILETKVMDDGKHQVGDFELLKGNSAINIDSMCGSGNIYGNVIIHQKSKLVPVENLFADPDLDPTLIDSNDEEMDCEKNGVKIKIFEA